jgi:hypothetical protein
MEALSNSRGTVALAAVMVMVVMVVMEVMAEAIPECFPRRPHITITSNHYHSLGKVCHTVGVMGIFMDCLLEDGADNMQVNLADRLPHQAMDSGHHYLLPPVISIALFESKTAVFRRFFYYRYLDFIFICNLIYIWLTPLYNG